MTAARALPSEVFDLPLDKMRQGYYSDAYFNYTKRVLERDGTHPHVLMQVFQSRQRRSSAAWTRRSRSCASARATTRPTASGCRAGTSSTCRRCTTATRSSPGRPCSSIEGDYALFCHLETTYLGSLARRTLVATNVREVVEAARGKPIMYFPARHDHYRVQTGDGYAAHVAGAIGVSTDAQASWWGGKGYGTVPHGLIAAYGGDTGQGVGALRRASCGEETNVVVLVDFDNDSRDDGPRRWRGRSGDQLWGVRLDTSNTMVDRSLWPQMGRFDPRGVNPQLVWNVRHALDAAGFGGRPHRRLGRLHAARRSAPSRRPACRSTATASARP